MRAIGGFSATNSNTACITMLIFHLLLLFISSNCCSLHSRERLVGEVPQQRGFHSDSDCRYRSKSQKMKNQAISPIPPITIAQTLRLRTPQTAIKASMMATITKNITPEALASLFCLIFIVLSFL